MPCNESNGIDGSLTRVLYFILWWVENRFLEPFRDLAYNWFWVLKPKQISGIRVFKFEKVYLGMGNVIKLAIGSHGPFYCFWPPIAKIACVSLIKTLVSDLGQKWCFCPWDIRGKGISSYNAMPRVQWNQRFLDPSLNLHSMASWNSLPKAL